MYNFITLYKFVAVWNLEGFESWRD